LLPPERFAPLSPSQMDDELAREMEKIDRGEGGDDSKSSTVRRRKNSLPLADDSAEDGMKEGSIISTLQSTYFLQMEYRRDTQGAHFDAIRRSDGWAVRLEFERSDDEDNKGLKRIDLEAEIERVLFHERDPTLVSHLLLCVDMGSHAPWTFAVFPQFLLTIPEFMIEADPSDKDRGTLLRIAIHSFMGLRNLHLTDIVHGSMRPDNILIGMERDCRRILIGNFTCASSNQKDLPKPTQMPNTTYASRGRQRNFEATRKDDLESWTYCVAEIFHKKLMPWNPDQKYLSENAAHKDSLHHKRAFCQGKLWNAQKEILFEEFRGILSLLSKVKAVADPPYESIWTLLCSAAKYYDLPIFGFSSWCKSNRGAAVTPSTLEVAVEPCPVEDFVSSLP
ncbi:hypothetical protein PRIPAC_73904, partial [Pristionchus pacificus]